MRIYWGIRTAVYLTASLHKITFSIYVVDKAGNFEYFSKTATSKILLKTSKLKRKLKQS